MCVMSAATHPDTQDVMSVCMCVTCEYVVRIYIPYQHHITHTVCRNTKHRTDKNSVTLKKKAVSKKTTTTKKS